MLSELQERRDHECRLIPERALETLDEAEAFLRDRGLLTRNPSGSLPSLFGACHEEPYKPGAGGFGEWPSTKWPWSFELALRPGVVAPKIHMGKTLYLSEETAGLVDPIVRAELDRMAESDEDWARVLAHLAEAGPSTPDDLLVELGLPRKDLKAIRAPLERCGVVVTRWEGEQSFLARWDQLVTRPAGGAARPRAAGRRGGAGGCGRPGARAGAMVLVALALGEGSPRPARRGGRARAPRARVAYCRTGMTAPSSTRTRAP